MLSHHCADLIIVLTSSPCLEIESVRTCRYEKRFMLQMDTAMVGPLVVAVWLEFTLGQVRRRQRRRTRETDTHTLSRQSRQAHTLMQTQTCRTQARTRIR
eukprot:COSAG06_NODE_1710_length_8634_cov_767.811365_7_plen_100_part_00